MCVLHAKFRQGDSGSPPDDVIRLYYTTDHLGSIREMVDGDGVLHARYDYDPYGNRTKLDGDLDADFGFTGHYTHEASGIVLAPYRGYDPGTAKWLSRDPIGENGGINLYGYVGNGPMRNVDPYGLDPSDTTASLYNGADRAFYDLANGSHFKAAAEKSSCKVTVEFSKSGWEQVYNERMNHYGDQTTLMLFDHGTPGEQSMRHKSIYNEEDKIFDTLLKGRNIKHLWLFGCNLAAGSGSAWLQRLANKYDVTVHASTAEWNYGKKLMGEIVTAPGGTPWTYAPGYRVYSPK